MTSPKDTPGGEGRHLKDAFGFSIAWLGFHIASWSLYFLSEEGEEKLKMKLKKYLEQLIGIVEP